MYSKTKKINGFKLFSAHLLLLMLDKNYSASKSNVQPIA